MAIAKMCQVNARCRSTHQQTNHFEDGIMDIAGSEVQFAATLKRLGGDQGLFQDLAEFYRQDSPALLQEIRDGLATGNLARVQRAAHRLRSMLENFDVERAATITRTIEQSCRRGELLQSPDLLSVLQEDMEALDSALQHYCQVSHDGDGEVTEAVAAVRRAR
jgi:HPt (histidine-containing phosphotransfer) domain-containing protein